ncbi:MAG: outer membrane protein transport protein [Desulfovermiculus sp.]|nr:outer membrane protein transport protein [Desulfovermiculus sp.]
MAVVFLAGSAMAGGIINKSNQSADYFRTLSRNAATDYADIASFNPAGIMQMEDGLYGKVDALYIAKDYSNDVPGYGKLDQDEPTIMPGVFTIYKQERWAGFFAFTIPGGGGELDYTDGNARTVDLAKGVAAMANSRFPAGTPSNLLYTNIDPGELKVKKSDVYGFTLGGSLAINDVWSVALGTRYSTGVREFDGEATISAETTIPGTNDPLNPELHLEEDADGWAGIVGVNYAPNEKFNAALTYISNTKMEYKMDVKKDTLGIAPSLDFADGSKRRIDIPGQLGFGASYRFLPDWKFDLSYTYYLEKDATIDTFENEGNSWDLGISGEYTFNEHWKTSLGYMRTEVKLSDNQQINEPEEPKLDANTIGAGLVWSPTQAWDFTLGSAYVMYDEVKDDRGIEYDKTVWSVSAGIQYRFF